jgi:hypothetical protein
LGKSGVRKQSKTKKKIKERKRDELNNQDKRDENKIAALGFS